MDHPHGLIVPLSCRVREGTFASGIRFVIYRSKGCRVSHPFPWHAVGKKGSCQDRNKRNVLPSHDRSITFISDCPRRSSEGGTKTIDKRGGKGGEVINGSPKQKEGERRRAINYFYRAGAEMRRLASLLLTPLPFPHRGSRLLRLN